MSRIREGGGLGGIVRGIFMVIRRYRKGDFLYLDYSTRSHESTCDKTA